MRRVMTTSRPGQRHRSERAASPFVAGCVVVAEHLDNMAVSHGADSDSHRGMATPRALDGHPARPPAARDPATQGMFRVPSLATQGGVAPIVEIAIDRTPRFNKKWIKK
jgi:hypothetical protein